jgi:hypothetical protein
MEETLTGPNYSAQVSLHLHATCLPILNDFMFSGNTPFKLTYCLYGHSNDRLFLCIDLTKFIKMLTYFPTSMHVANFSDAA